MTEQSKVAAPGKRMRKALIFASLFSLFYWFVLRADPAVTAINDALQMRGSAALKEYPYQFRVLRLEDGVAVMGSPRSYEVPVFRMMGAIHPNLAGKSPADPDFIAAEKELASVQAEARQIVQQQSGVREVKWELDQGWLIEHNIPLH